MGKIFLNKTCKLILVSVFLTLTSCVDENEKFIGYLVAKEYTPERMCCDNTKTMCYAGYVYVHIPHNAHHHSKQKAEYYFYLANKNEVIKKSITPELFYSIKLGTKMIIKRY